MATLPMAWDMSLVELVKMCATGIAYTTGIAFTLMLTDGLMQLAKGRERA